MVLCGSFAAHGQDCGTLSLADTINICAGGTATITATATSTGTIESLTWSPTTGLSSSTTPSTTITGTTSGYYYITMIETDGPNLVVNPNFSAGNTGFTSAYSYVTPASSALWFENRYTITTNPSSCHPSAYSHGDHTTGSGNMMAINGASTSVNVWTQTVAVTPNTNYNFSAWVANWSASVLPSNCPILQFQVNGTSLETPDTILSPSGTWREFQAVWNSGTATTATINVRNMTTAIVGNDFSLDDISFRKVCVTRDSIYVNVGDVASSIAITGPTTAAPGTSVTVTASVAGVMPGYTIKWYNRGALIGITGVPNITYTKGTEIDTITAVILQESGCTDSITSNIHEVLVDPNTATAQTAKPKFIIHPNPVHGMATISIPAGTINNIAVIDLLGRDLSSQILKNINTIGKQWATLDMNTLPKGTYLIKVMTSDGALFIERLTKE